MATPASSPVVQRVEILQQPLSNNQTKTHQLYTLPSHRSSMVTISAIVHDVNSDTNRRFFCATYAWFREWDQAPKRVVLNTQFDNNTGSGPAVYAIDSIANGNNIEVQIAQRNFDTASYYSIIADITFATT